MAKVFIEETTLTAIGDAIRGKEGTTALVPVNDMATRITSLQTGSNPVIKSLEITSNGTYTATDCDGYSPITVNVPQDGAPTDEELTLTGDCNYRFAYEGWNWFIDKYRDRITTKDISSATSMFYMNTQVEEIPFQININNISDVNNTFYGCNNLRVCPKIRGSFRWTTSTSLNCASSARSLRDIEDLFEADMLDYFSTYVCKSAYSFPYCFQLNTMISLKRTPSWWSKFQLNPESTAFPALSKILYYQMQDCVNIDEILDMPVWNCKGESTSNMFGSSFSNFQRAKNITFETNEYGTPKTARWKNQTVSLSNNVGYGTNTTYLLSYNTGLTEANRVTNDATYQALKNDPDWFTTSSAYSRYNHDSAVNTINSLPDTSAYLATAGGTNTIKFKGASGSLTDGGAINTLTEAEIAVAAAKGWTVTLV